MTRNRGLPPARANTRRVLALGCLVLFLAACSRDARVQRLPTAAIELGGRTLAVEVARTRAQRQTGLMFRRELGADEGMLFVFRRDDNLAFFMKNTYVPLSIAFIQSDGVIANIAHMEPLSLATHRSSMPCRYALEMPQGWFIRKGVKEGDRVVIPAGLTAEE